VDEDGVQVNQYKKPLESDEDDDDSVFDNNLEDMSKEF